MGKAKKTGHIVDALFFGGSSGSSSSSGQSKSKKQTSRKVHDSKGKPTHTGKANGKGGKGAR